MRSPAAAIAWELTRRHRWGLTAIACYIAALALGRIWYLDPSTRFEIEDNDLFVFSIVMPLSMTYLYLVVMFCFGMAGDIGTRESRYPARMFTLPVTTAALAGWPMLYGMVLMAALWVAVTLLALWPAGVIFPVGWPAIFAAVFLGWAQVLMWTPFGVPRLRVVASVALLISVDAVVIVAINYEIPESTMIAALSAQLPLTYVLARLAVARARRGEVPDWLARWRRTDRERSARVRRHFTSAARAQFWFEWRQHGWTLPLLVASVVPFELALLFLPGGGQGVVFYTLIPVAFTPRLMAGFASLSIRTPNPDDSDPHAMAPFLATRPVSSAALIAAKLQTTLASTMLAWLFMSVAVPLALWRAEAWPVIDAAFAELAIIVGRTRAFAIVGIAFAWLVVTTWKQMVQGLCIGLTGREWLIRANSALVVGLTVWVFPILDWLREDREFREAALDALPWILAALVAAKMTLAAWVAARLVAGSQLSDRLLIAGACAWAATVLAIYGGLARLFDAPQLPGYYFALFAILVVPLARLSAAPLALAWNRHR